MKVFSAFSANRTILSLLFCSGFSGPALGQYTWMNPDVGKAWSKGYQGANANLIVHDTFKSFYITAKINSKITVRTTQAHGNWVADIAKAVAPESSVQAIQWDTKPELAPSRFNIVNMSYAIPGTKGQPYSHFSVSMATQGTAVVVKAAGNYNANMTVLDQKGGTNYDLLNFALKGLPGVIFAGSLNQHGDTATNKQATKASYSNYPGADRVYQSRFLMVGVPTSLTLAGTSFAAPQLSAYAAIISSKFKEASPIQIADQMLKTARTDTIKNYNPATFGRGEASLNRALSPISLR